jgi:hypothetical protein
MQARASQRLYAALRKLASMHAQKRLLALGGKVKFSMSLGDMRYDRG